MASRNFQTPDPGFKTPKTPKLREHALIDMNSRLSVDTVAVVLWRRIRADIEWV